MRVEKRKGIFEELDLDKIHRVITWAAEGLDGVSVSEVELKANIQLYDGMKTSDLHETIIKAAADLISASSPDYQYLSARLAIFHNRKKAFGEYQPPTLWKHLNKMVEKNLYDSDLLTRYTKEEIDLFDSFIVHDRDLNLSYAAVKQYEGKYFIQNRVTGEIFESPQFAIMGQAMALYQDDPDNKEFEYIRADYIKDYYDDTSLFKSSWPTPISSGARTPTKQFSSCVKIEPGDSLDSINAAVSSVVKYISQRAGIGVNIGQIRALGSPIRNGEAFHTGVIPFIKHFQTAVKSCSQGGVRGGAATIFYPMWHLEFESLIVLKNNKGVEENRARHLDYGIQINKTLYKRMISGGDITFFSPSDVPGLYEAFTGDQEEFERLYTLYEKDDSIRKKTMAAIDAFSLLAQERMQTGRIYIQNIDHSNTHSSFIPEVASIKQSNLCMEITLPTKPMVSTEDENGEIALCTLAGFNMGTIDFFDYDEMERISNMVVRTLDNLLSYQDYPIKAAEVSTLNRRSLGVGVTNFANFLAKNGCKYSDDSGVEITHKAFESLQYHLLKASVKLAKERGKCGWFHETKYSQGILPIDTYERNVDSLYPGETYELDWESLRTDILKYGLRNSTMTALMPAETSSQLHNATNGIEAPRGVVSVKASKDGILKQVVPNIKELGGQYELLWQRPNNRGYINLVAIMQKFVDQSISANTNYDPTRFEEEKIPVKLVLQDILYAYKMGLKTLYYHQTRDNASDDSAEEDITNCAGGACSL